ncbi:MAG: tRNA 2-thiouridine(34) synthase MnmA [Prevotella sp.]|nr:tRNA 2-thiouridine(34) synthase MnmA [Prevotella sp.]MCM1075220.1 tRNA 2-thiouridine(34) synthase MnmA [Ruminococcus sp.]
MKIAVLLSGGVDSAVTVHLLKEQGHDLHLFYIRIGRDDDSGDCNADEDIEMCRLIARRYNLPFEIIPLHDEYWANVMQYSLDTVKQGLTPHPDMMCNKIIKFGYFEQRRGHEFDKTATGHYADICQIDGKYYLATAADPVKDQTDFLAQISYEQLSHILFPLGKFPKARVREIAKEINLPNATRKDSQGICFLGKINYNDFLRRHLGEKPGPIIDISTGKKIGEHKGYWFHTIGQRKGLGLSGGPWYVVKKNVRDNVVYVSNGYDTHLQYGKELPLVDIHWITSNPFAPEQTVPGIKLNGNKIEISFKNRHTPGFTSATLEKLEDDTYIVNSQEDIQGIAPGQFAIIYTPDTSLCLGSGVISIGNKKRRIENG